MNTAEKRIGSIDFVRLGKASRFGVPIGVAVGISSFSYTHSIVRASITGCVVALIGTLIQARFEQKAFERRRSKGIVLTNAPVRPKIILELASTPSQAMTAYRSGLTQVGLRIKRVEVDESLRIVVVTRASFNSFGERITAQAAAIAETRCSLELSSVPRLFTARVDLGVNYTNVFLLSKFIRDNLGAAVILNERLVDLEDE